MLQAATRHIQLLLQLPEARQHLPYLSRLEAAVSDTDKLASRDQVCPHITSCSPESRC